MPKASEVAAELRKLADALDCDPEQELFRPEIDFTCKYKSSFGRDKAKKIFIALARILPHPLKKGTQSFDSEAIELRHTSDALIVVTSIERTKVCKLIEPAKTIPAVYKCEPLLSAEEDAALTEA